MNCQKCGANVADNTPFCPNCGAPMNAAVPEQQPMQQYSPVAPAANPKKPIYKKWWFWVIIGILAIGIISSIGSRGKIPEVSVDETIDLSSITLFPQKDDEKKNDNENEAAETEKAKETKAPSTEAPKTEPPTTEAPTTEPPTTAREYIKCTATELFDLLKNNAMKAKNQYEGQYVEISGYVSNIDASGKYISIGGKSDDYEHMFESIQCYIKTDEQKNQVMELSTDQYVTLKGVITSVGEILGYSMNIESIS